MLAVKIRCRNRRTSASARRQHRFRVRAQGPISGPIIRNDRPEGPHGRLTGHDPFVRPSTGLPLSARTNCDGVGAPYIPRMIVLARSGRLPDRIEPSRRPRLARGHAKPESRPAPGGQWPSKAVKEDVVVTLSGVRIRTTRPGVSRSGAQTRVNVPKPVSS